MTMSSTTGRTGVQRRTQSMRQWMNLDDGIRRMKMDDGLRRMNLDDCEGESSDTSGAH